MPQKISLTSVLSLTVILSLILAQVVRGGGPQPGEVIYFVLTDRFENGNSGNDFAGRAPNAVSEHGLVRSHPQYYHGGDLKGLTNRLDYLQGLGVTAIWITPPFRNQWVQFGSAAYHGYWILDFLAIDPHLGTDQEFRDFVAAAHSRGIKVILDIVVNHTADVNYYKENLYDYRSKTTHPYKDAAGVVFDDRDHVYDGVAPGFFPSLSAQSSFPYTPLVPSALTAARNPAWLNDVRNYHNRGNSNFSGEDSLYGDFVGLDDVFTEKPEVVEGMIDIFAHWINEYGIDGFRIDTVKHVNVEFWQVFTERIRAVADARGIGHFFMFGEVFDYDPRMLSEYSTWAGLDGVLDFGFMGAVRGFVGSGGPASQVRAFFENDSLYRDADSDEALLPVFISNHDGGVERFGFHLRNNRGGLPDATQVKLMAQAHAFMFFARGQPVIYYGDEQGFVGGGADWEAREDMMPSQVLAYNDNVLIGTSDRTSVSNFKNTHPLYQAIAAMSSIYRDPAHEALRAGAQVVRSTGDESVFALSRFDPQTGREYLFVAGNHATGVRTVDIPVNQAAGANWQKLGGGASVNSVPAAGVVRVNVPAAEWGVFRGDIPPVGPAPAISFKGLIDGGSIALVPHERSGVRFPGRARITVEGNSDLLSVDFEVNDGSGWKPVALDVGPPYEVHFRPRSDDPALVYALRATARDHAGRTASTQVEQVRIHSGVNSEYLVVHFREPSGLYTDPEASNAWGVEVQGDGLAEGNAFIPFRGPTSFGYFAATRLSDPSRPVLFRVLRRNGSDSLTEDFHRVVPARHGQIWTVAGEPRLYYDPILAQGDLGLHLKVPRDGNWRLRIEAGASAPSTVLIDSLVSIGSDSFGRIFSVPAGILAPLIESRHSLWVSVIEPEGGLDDGGARRIRLPQSVARFWIQSDSPRLARSEAEFRGVAVIHYHRPGGDYGNLGSTNDFWGLHLWEGAAQPTQWTAPRKPVREDAFGKVFEVALAPGATRLAYIIHRGDDKDPGPDQFLTFDTNGHEVWQIQGASAATPYAVATGFVPVGPGPDRSAALAALQPSLSLTGRFRYFATEGLTYTLQRSTDLSFWENLDASVPGQSQLEEVGVDLLVPAFFRILVE